MCLFLLIFLRCGFDVLCVSDWYVMSTTVWIHFIRYYDIIYFLRWTIKNKDTIFWFIPFHTPQQQALQTDTGYFSSISHLPMSVNVFQRTFFCLFFGGGCLDITEFSRKWRRMKSQRSAMWAGLLQLPSCTGYWQSLEGCAGCGDHNFPNASNFVK